MAISDQVLGERVRREAGTARIVYGDFGDADAVPASRCTLLVHGGLFDAMDGERFWRKPGIVTDLVAAGFRVLVPDRRFATGHTSAPFAVHSWDVEAADLATVLDAAGIDRAHVVTGSNGCSAVARFALVNPGRVTSLVLGWPVAAHTPELGDAFERSASFIEANGTRAYLALLRERGVPRPGSDCVGFPFGVALLHDERLAGELVTLDAAQAARIVRETGRVLLPGDPIRGLTPCDAQTLGSLDIGISIVPPAPEDPFHTVAAARKLANAIPGARLSEGFPVPPSPHFTGSRERFGAWLTGVLSCAS